MYEESDFISSIIKEIAKECTNDKIKLQLMTKQVRKVSHYSIDDIDVMDGYEFEEFIALLFRKMGYSVEVTKKSGDQGLKEYSDELLNISNRLNQLENGWDYELSVAKMDGSLSINVEELKT